uniref:NADH dehydrogenase subunit 6 n=1 Tax=Echinorhynchus truttae TaxID=185727 RepID=K0J9U8_9BILA|nr:NADH dehydrogenase subunit 6 [Echinorhynchus truttae]CCA94459.1 NADH dehydrogenase subunit 6 [Echinorhynchus truttae]
MFSVANWEGWLVLSLVYLGGVFVLMLYIGCSDTYSTFSVGFIYYLLSFLVLVKVGGLCGVSHNSMPEVLWFTSSSGTVLLMSGFVLCSVMVVTNTFIYASEGALRG